MEEPLTPANIIGYGAEVLEGKAEREDALRLLATYCDHAEGAPKPLAPLLAHLHKAFARYLRDKRKRKSLAVLLGEKRTANGITAARLRDMLRDFCERPPADAGIPPEMIDYLREAFRLYLAKPGADLDVVLGLKHPRRGRPAEKHKELDAALSVIRSRYLDKPWMLTWADAQIDSTLRETRVKESWRRWQHSHELRVLFRIRRIIDGKALTHEQARELMDGKIPTINRTKKRGG